MTPKEFKTIRINLNLSQRGLADFFRMGKHGHRNIARWEKNEQDIPNWAILILEIIIDDEIPDLEPYRNTTY